MCRTFSVIFYVVYRISPSLFLHMLVSHLVFPLIISSEALSYAKSKTQIENVKRHFSIWMFQSEEKSYLCASLCDRVLTISGQHFSIKRFRSRPRTEMRVIFYQRRFRSKNTGRQYFKACAWPTHKKPRENTRDTATHTPKHTGSDHKGTQEHLKAW